MMKNTYTVENVTSWGIDVWYEGPDFNEAKRVFDKLASTEIDDNKAEVNFYVNGKVVNKA